MRRARGCAPVTILALGSLGAALPWTAAAGTAASPVAAPAARAPAASARPAAAAAHHSHGRFKDFVVYAPAGTPGSAVLLLSGAAGWDASVAQLAGALRAHGALVIGIDTPKLEADLEADDLENLSHFVQAYYHLPTYLAPFLVGYGSGAGLAYAVLVQAPPSTFAGALTVGFCPSVTLHKPLCQGEGLQYERRPGDRRPRYFPAAELRNPWVTLQAEAGLCSAAALREFVDRIHGAALVGLPGVHADLEPAGAWMAQFLAAFDTLVRRAERRLAPLAPAALEGLPVVEVPAAPAAAPSDLLAIILSGDGGWAGLDKEVAQALAEHGIPVAGLDSLRYFWSARTPQGLATDIDRMIRYYLAHFGKQRVLLIGYSQGADVLPFALDRLPAAARSRIALAVLIGMSEHALFEFHVSSWISDSTSGPATLPEVDRIVGVPMLCIYGEDEDDSLCPKLDAAKVKIVKLEGGHHFNGDYAGLARAILATLRR